MLMQEDIEIPAKHFLPRFLYVFSYLKIYQHIYVTTFSSLSDLTLKGENLRRILE